MNDQVKIYVHEESDSLFGIKGTKCKILPLKDANVKDVLWIVGKLMADESDSHGNTLPSWIESKLPTAHRYYLNREDFASLFIGE